MMIGPVDDRHRTMALGILIASTLLQAFAAAQATGLALRRRSAGWYLLATAMALMLGRFALSLHTALTAQRAVDPPAAFVTLAMALLLAVGTGLLARGEPAPASTPADEKLPASDGTAERRKLELDLADSRDRLQTIIDTEPECVKVIDRRGNLLEMNRAGLEMLEAESLAQAQEQPLLDYVAPSHRAAFGEVHRRVMAGQSAVLEFEVVGRRGTHRWLETHAAPLRDRNGEIFALLGVTRDITERRRLEEQFRQAQKMEAIGQLAGGVAHDFNNMLTVIEGNASLLLASQTLPADHADRVQQILRAAERAANLTRQLLLVSRRQVLQQTVLDLNEVVAGTTRMLQRVLGEDIALQTDCAPAPLRVRADAGLLEQVILNLAVNARDAMPGGGQLLIMTRDVTLSGSDPAPGDEDRRGRFAVLGMTDTGSGISPENLPRIFEPFFTTKEVGKGTGLGLATAYGIVRQHQGWVEVASEPGRGTTFSVYLPAAEETAAIEKPRPTADPWPRGSETILVVEDEAPLRQLVGETLRRSGYTVLTAESGASALGLWRREHDRIDLLLTDLVMPDGLTGRELGRRLLAEKPELKVLYTSGYSAEIAGDEEPMVEGVDFLAKPYPPHRLAQLVRQRLDGA